MNRNPSSLSLLAIDTSQAACSVALFTENHLSEKFEVLGNKHTDFLLSMINSLLKDANMSLSDLNLLAFGKGPGSFTGLRIAASVIQGLSMGLGLAVIPVSSLAAIAFGAHQQKGWNQICAIMDARMKEVYWGLFEFDKNDLPILIGKESLGKEQDIILPERINSQDTDIQNEKNEWQKVIEYPRARDIALIAVKEYALGNAGGSIELALPTYIRDNIL